LNRKRKREQTLEDGDTDEDEDQEMSEVAKGKRKKEDTPPHEIAAKATSKVRIASDLRLANK
jgi:hypothetical protein